MKNLMPLLCAAAIPLQAAHLYVAPGGHDGAAGTRDAPLRTLAAARDAARKLLGQEAVTIHVADGVYYLPETLVFTAADSGTAEKPALYKAEREGGVVISGGQRLDLAWEPWRGGIFKAAVPTGLSMDQLFVNRVRQRMARYPNHDPAKTTEAYQGWAVDAFSKERAARWSDPAGGYIHAMHSARWGGYHYRITGKKPDGGVAYEGGWQNNRQMGMHKQYRMVENILEELDAPGEWFHDAQANVLFLQPAPGTDLSSATIETVRLRHLVEFRGTQAEPVRFVTLQGFVFRHAARSFMDTKEPLLRSDWTIYRGGALFFNGAEDCAVLDSELDQLGGNGVFVNRFNRRIRVVGCDIHDTGASALAFVGDAGAVRNPLFEYGQRQEYAAIDRTPGPRSDDFPADCVVEDCLIRHAGEVEKQATGVQISMAQGITVRHCSIYDMSRAGLNIGDGTWGGHLIEGCDVFDTVLETHDHGSFNAWGRDRFWGLKNAPPGELPALARLDAVQPTIIRNSRWRCDHGWDVDLDDGSSNYQIYNNLFLRGGLKLREGFHRHVWNNIAVNNGLHPHVWYENSGDVVTNNIWMAAHQPALMPKGTWGQEVDRNLFTREADRARFAANGCDAHSVVGDPMFVDPAVGDYRVKEGSPALAMGFRNFPMDQFGVRKPTLRAQARTPALPLAQQVPVAAGASVATPELTWMGAILHGLEGEEFSAFGVSKEEGGVQVVEVPAGSPAAAAGLLKDDLIQQVNGRSVRSVAGLLEVVSAASDALPRIRVVRGQKAQMLTLDRATYVRVESAAALVPAAGAAGQTTANRATANDPLGVLTDGQLAEGYGPVFPNGVRDGAYKLDLGAAKPVLSVSAWSWNENGNRGRQLVTVYGSAAATDPGWKVGDRATFTPLGSWDAQGQHFIATSLRARVGESLGSWRWLVWRVHPVTTIGENTAFQELAVEVGQP